MFVATLKAEKSFGLPTGAARHDLPPNTPELTFRLTIHFAALGTLAAAWLSSRSSVADRWRLPSAVSGSKTTSHRPTLGEAAIWVATALPLLAIALDVVAREAFGVPDLLGGVHDWLVATLRTNAQGLAWAGLCCLALALSFRALRRSALCTIHIVLLRPHEPLPPVPPALLRRRSVHVFAVRALGYDTRQKFFGFLEQAPDRPATYRSTSWELCEPGPRRGVQRVPWRDYWSLVRCCLTYMLPQNSAEPEFGVASNFTSKQHRSLLRFYLFLALMAVLPPLAQQIGWLEAVPKELKQIVALGSIGWVIAGVMLHRAISLHLRRWEQHTRTFPFRGSPILKRVADGGPGQWIEVPTDTFDLPMRNFGMSYAQLQQVALAVLLVILLTLLQLIG